MNAVREAIKQIEVGWKSQKIRVMGCSLVETEMVLLKETLMNHSSVKSLELCLCEISQSEIILLAKDLQQFNLFGLQLVHVQIDDKTTQALATAVQECSLKKLDLAFNQIGPVGARALGEALKDCGLESLLLGRNKIGPEGTKYIANILGQGGSSLRTLDVTRNKIGDVGVIALAKALPKSGLDSLLMATNLVTHKGVKAVCEALRQSPNMLNLSLGDNRLGDESIVLLADTLQYTNIQRLCLNTNDFGSEGVRALCTAIQNSNTLEMLDLKQNPKLTDNDMALLMRSVKTHRTMKTIVVDETGTSDEGRERLRKCLVRLHDEHAKTMTVLCSVRLVPRVGLRSSFSQLPVELMRGLSKMLLV